MAEYIPNWKGLEAYHYTGSNQAQLKTQVEKVGGSTYTDEYGNFYLIIDKSKFFMPPNYVLKKKKKRAGKLYKKSDFDIAYKDYSDSGTDISAGEGIKVSASGKISADFNVLAKKEDLDKNVFVAVYNQTTSQELLDYLATTNKPYAPIIVERGGQYYTAILSFKQNEETAYIRLLGSASGEYTIFNHTIKGKTWGTETATLQKKIDLTAYATKTELNTKQDKLTAGDGVAIDTSTNTISADLSSAFKFVQKNAVAITIPANTRTNVIVADILEAPYQIAGFRQIGILKGDGGDDIGWKNCVIQSYSTTNVGKSAQIQVRNTGATEAIINVSVNVLAFKKTS